MVGLSFYGKYIGFVSQKHGSKKYLKTNGTIEYRTTACWGDLEMDLV